MSPGRPGCPLLWTVTTVLFLSLEVEVDAGHKEMKLPCQPAVIDLTMSDDDNTPTMPHPPINCIQALLSEDDDILQPVERCVVDLT